MAFWIYFIIGLIITLAILKYSAEIAYGKSSWKGAFIQWIGIIAIQFIITVLTLGINEILS